jgi:uncharacterized protein (TIGR02118 family)
MLKLTFCLHRLPHLSREEFHHYWRATHARVVRKHARALRIQRYVQCHTLTVPANEAIRTSRGTAEPYDGIAEVWWQSMDDLNAALSTPEGREADRALRQDEARFIDLARSAAWFCEQHEIIGT